jgi:hypothetical protein
MHFCQICVFQFCRAELQNARVEAAALFRATAGKQGSFSCGSAEYQWAVEWLRNRLGRHAQAFLGATADAAQRQARAEEALLASQEEARRCARQLQLHDEAAKRAESLRKEEEQRRRDAEAAATAAAGKQAHAEAQWARAERLRQQEEQRRGEAEAAAETAKQEKNRILANPPLWQVQEQRARQQVLEPRKRCMAVAARTNQQCRKMAVPGSDYCHIEAHGDWNRIR